MTGRELPTRIGHSHGGHGASAAGRDCAQRTLALFRRSCCTSVARSARSFSRALTALRSTLISWTTCTARARAPEQAASAQPEQAPPRTALAAKLPILCDWLRVHDETIEQGWQESLACRQLGRGSACHAGGPMWCHVAHKSKLPPPPDLQMDMMIFEQAATWPAGAHDQAAARAGRTVICPCNCV